ncbi:cytochrome P450 [Fomitopsis serialis]|uniref:cytochrome P450 n=1 Tax=Fomitopsis serialis TaxID=139415 RepID=UPI0020081923|nr:cytochrome P450 [Neoantrodia serialis]KAH9924737.1 cytochrome P450 [Neoantrodia serialis]
MPVIHQLTSDISDNPFLLLAIVPVALVLVQLAAHFKDASGLRSYPGPFLAKFTDAWMFWVVSHNRWSSTVDSLHRKYGTFVRLSPNHVSISDPRALNAIYGHSAGFMKAGFYDIFANFRVRNIFNTRSRTEHARKRRIEAHMFAPQSIRAIEPISHAHVSGLLRQWDYLASRMQEAQHGAGPLKGQLGSTTWNVQNGRVWIDCMPWLNFWAFDTIGDLAFGLPFGMLKAGKDVARVAKNPEEGYKAIEKFSEGADKLSIEEEDIPYIEVLSTRAEAIAPLAFISRTWQTILQQLPGYGSNRPASKKLAALSIMAVARRLANPSGRPDMLQKLLEARDDDGKPLSPVELSAEAFVLIVAGSDTIANTTCGTMYYLARDQRVQATLQAELDAALASLDSEVAPYDAVKDLPYLDAVIFEGQRLYATIGAGLPREVPAGGATILGHHFKKGTWVSVPLYHLHRDESVWGPDAAEFRPERWTEASPEHRKQMMDAFAPFSIGPRACIGRSLAIMQLHIILATLFRRYQFALKSDAR